jgi:hypothetical protein
VKTITRDSILFGPSQARVGSRQIGRCKLRYEHRGTEGAGRFGGGWQWSLGVEAGNLSRKRGTIILNLLVSSLRISWS